MPIHFECQRCGACCRIEGQVRLTDVDLMRLSVLLGLSEPDFIQQYTELAADRRGLVLKDQPDGACVFLKGSDCRVNPMKPQQCAEFPQAWNNPGWERLCKAASAPAISHPRLGLPLNS
ncbi:MAG: YkgJ family cysteine cluster protein [Verrucomicrobia bacterium]|nr:YkgJ family cysteine cluster protein [Verrucomicrobiota bacterium]